MDLEARTKCDICRNGNHLRPSTDGLRRSRAVPLRSGAADRAGGQFRLADGLAIRDSCFGLVHVANPLGVKSAMADYKLCSITDVHHGSGERPVNVAVNTAICGHCNLQRSAAVIKVR